MLVPNNATNENEWMKFILKNLLLINYNNLRLLVHQKKIFLFSIVAFEILKIWKKKDLLF